jgi:superfamily I DNA and/or RNA helicase
MWWVGSLISIPIIVDGLCFEICTTCIGAASSELRNIDFPVVFLDEASMATEPASLIPLMKGVSDSLIDETWPVHALLT